MDSKATKSLAVLSVILVGLIGLAGLVWLPRADGDDEDEPQEFVIERGDGSYRVARLLGQRDLVRSKYLFIFYTVLVGKEKEFKAGRYLISKSMNIPEIVQIFSAGSALSDDVMVTIPEGTNVAEIDRILAKAGLVGEGQFLTAALAYEGWLFPDTYRLNQPPVTGSRLSAQEVIKKMRENFDVKTKAALEGLNDQRIKEVVIIASMLEKEVQTEKDMRLVAGIIEKRLKLGMLLEVDATVSYGVCYSKFLEGKYCDVALANIVDNIPVDSEYNTYSRKGLPAGPVANPGLAAVKAALDPEASDYLYYLSARDGTTIFSKTAADHLRARRKYLGV